jgi:hypothetical protein
MAAPHRFIDMGAKGAGPDADDLRFRATRFGPDDPGSVAVCVKDGSVAAGLACEVNLTPKDAADAGVAFLQEAGVLGAVADYGGKTAIIFTAEQVEYLAGLARHDYADEHEGDAFEMKELLERHLAALKSRRERA